MFGIILIILAVWLVLVILGFVIKGLLWLAIIGIILFVVTAGYAWTKRRLNR